MRGLAFSLFEHRLNAGDKLFISNNAYVPLGHLAAPVKEDRHRQPSDTQLFGYTSFPSDRKGQREGFH